MCNNKTLYFIENIFNYKNSFNIRIYYIFHQMYKKVTENDTLYL